jgi:hypothetical protein
MSKKLVITLSDEQVNQIKKHLATQGEINQKEETFSGYTFTLSCLECGICWLDVEMNETLHIGDVNWSFE